MSLTPKKIIEKNNHGEIVFTPYGEFLSYYHAHLQLFNRLIERKKLSKGDSENLTQNIKSFMMANIKKTDHFFENITNFAGMLGVNQVTLQDFLNANFLETLNRVQEKLKAQETEKFSTPSGRNKQYNSILEELNDLFGNSLQKNIKFIKEDGRTILVDLTTGNQIESKSAKSTEEVQEHAIKKKEPEIPIQRGPEKSILKELIELFGDDLKGQMLEVQNPNQFNSGNETTVQSSTEAETAKEELIEIEDLQFEDELIKDNQSNNENSNDGEDLDFLLSQVPEQPKDPVDDFTYKNYSYLMKTIQSYQTTNDTSGYTKWMSGCTQLEKCFISIRNYIAKEQKGEAINWESLFKGISQKTDLAESSLVKLKKRIEIFRKTKSIQDLCIQELKGLPSQILGIVKAAWPHISNSFEFMPDVDAVENSIQNILTRIKNENERKPISIILINTILKLRVVSS